MPITLTVVRGAILQDKKWLEKYHDIIKVFNLNRTAGVMGRDTIISTDLSPLYLGSGSACQVQLIDKNIADTVMTIAREPKTFLFFGGKGWQMTPHANLSLKRAGELTPVPANSPPLPLQEGDELHISKDSIIRVSLATRLP